MRRPFDALSRRSQKAERYSHCHRLITGANIIIKTTRKMATNRWIEANERRSAWHLPLEGSDVQHPASVSRQFNELNK